MKPIRIILGLALIIAAALPSHIFYTRMNHGNFKDPTLFMTMLAAAATSFAVFSCSKLIPSYRAQLISGILGSYCAFLGLVFLWAAIKGDFAETYMWTPIIILFGIPFMAPMVALSWLASTLVFGLRK